MAGLEGDRRMCLGIKSFFCKVHRKAWSGFPEPSPTTIVVGRFEALKSLRHKNVIAYLDIKQGRHDRLLVLTEHYRHNLERLVLLDAYNISDLAAHAEQVTSALAFLHRQGIVVATLRPSNVQIDMRGVARLADYGLHYLLSDRDVLLSEFSPVQDPHYLPPESLARGPRVDVSPPADTWALGMLLMDVVEAGRLKLRLASKATAGDAIVAAAAISGVGSPTPLALDEQQQRVERWMAGAGAQWQSDRPRAAAFIRACLEVDPRARPSPELLLGHEWLRVEGRDGEAGPERWRWCTVPVLRSELRLEGRVGGALAGNEEADPLAGMPLADVAYYWQMLVGGHLEGAYNRVVDTESARAPILRMPSIVRLATAEGGGSAAAEVVEETAAVEGAHEYSEATHAVDLGPLRARLVEAAVVAGRVASGGELDPLPIGIREQDINYQHARVAEVRRVLEALPDTREELLRTARIDVPPLLRGQIWAGLLGVPPPLEARESYAAIDKYAEGPADKQIDVDIPRCHQYHALLSSPEGHAKLRRVLKAWVRSNTQLVYWQGLDSLCAPFLVLHFSDEAMVYHSLNNIVHKYLRNFFVADNSAVMREHLAVFEQLLTFHDPVLACHLHELGFMPELYAISWFLTLFAHVFPLNQVFHLWDTLLLGPPSLPIFLGVGLLRHLRSTLLAMDFNACILLFSDMPTIDIDVVVSTTLDMFNASPDSLRHREATGEAKEKGSHMWWEAPLDLAVLRSERCPRVTYQDLTLLEPNAVLVDIRSADDFSRLHHPLAISVPGGDEEALERLEAHRGKYIGVVGKRGDACSDVAAALVDRYFPYVAVLSGGMDALMTFARSSLRPS